jgi:hypothetical protein
MKWWRPLFWTVCVLGTSVTVAADFDVPVLPAGSHVPLRLLEPVGSHSHRSGSQLAMEIARDVEAGGKIVLPRGTPVLAEVVHAAKSGGFGRPGELTLAARYATLDQRIVRFRALLVGAVAADRHGAVTAARVAGEATSAAHSVRVLLPDGSTGGGGGAGPAVAGLLVMTAVRGKDVRVAMDREFVAETASDEAFGTGSAQPPVTAVQPAASKIVFFRPRKAAGMLLNFIVRENETELGKLLNGSYFEIDVAPGLHRYVVHSETQDVLTIEAVAGATHYVVATSDAGVLVRRPNLAPSDELAFQAVAAKLRALPSLPAQQE